MTKIELDKVGFLQKLASSTLSRAATIGLEVRKARLSPEASLCCTAIVTEVTDSLIDIKESLDWLTRAQDSESLTKALFLCTIARATARITHNGTLLNEATQIIDGGIDIWGKPTPRGGLWDK